MNPITLQTIFLTAFAAYAAAHALPAFVHKAAWCIMHCRTAVMGGHAEACPEGHFERNHYNSCRHRACPLCAYIQVQKWLARQKSRILACDHYHVIFTVPHELNPIWKYNTRLMAGILFTGAQRSIFELLKDPKHLGATPGVIASLHTWTRTLALHPHIHCLVTGGGYDGRWIPLKRDYLFPMAAVRVLFRAKVLEAIRSAWKNGQLVLPPSLSGHDLAHLLVTLYRKKWNVHIQNRYRHGEGVLTYLARYLKGGPISRSRLLGLRDGRITFRTGRETRETLPLPLSEFIHRFVQHILPPGCVTVRHYGIYAGTRKKDLRKCRRILGQPEEEPREATRREIPENAFPNSRDARKCPKCGRPLIRRPLPTRLPMPRLRKGPAPPA